MSPPPTVYLNSVNSTYLSSCSNQKPGCHPWFFISSCHSPISTTLCQFCLTTLTPVPKPPPPPLALAQLTCPFHPSSSLQRFLQRKIWVISHLWVNASLARIDSNAANSLHGPEFSGLSLPKSYLYSTLAIQASTPVLQLLPVPGKSKEHDPRIVHTAKLPSCIKTTERLFQALTLEVFFRMERPLMAINQINNWGMRKLLISFCILTRPGVEKWDHINTLLKLNDQAMATE